MEYNLRTDNGWRFIALVGLCFVGFLVALVLLFVVVILGFKSSDGEGLGFIATIGAGLGVALVPGVPVAIYFLFRRRLSATITVRLLADRIEIQKRDSTRHILTDDIKSFETYRGWGDAFEWEVVVIRLKKGSKIRMKSSTWAGRVEEMVRFRKDFEAWAVAHQLTEWQPWYRR